MRDTKATLALLAICALLTTLALSGLAHGTGSTLAALERVPVHKTDRDEDLEERRKRLREIADAIDGATANLDERAWLAMTARRESGLAKYVSEDHARCSTGQGGVCDGGRSYSVWQLRGTKRDLTKAEQAVEALKRFKRAANYCHSRGVDYWEGGTSQYALLGLGPSASAPFERPPEFGGERINLAELARRTGIQHSTISWRYRHGMRSSEQLAAPDLRRSGRGGEACALVSTGEREDLR